MKYVTHIALVLVLLGSSFFPLDTSASHTATFDPLTQSKLDFPNGDDKCQITIDFPENPKLYFVSPSSKPYNLTAKVSASSKCISPITIKHTAPPAFRTVYDPIKKITKVDESWSQKPLTVTMNAGETKTISVDSALPIRPVDVVWKGDGEICDQGDPEYRVLPFTELTGCGTARVISPKFEISAADACENTNSPRIYPILYTYHDDTYSRSGSQAEIARVKKAHEHVKSDTYPPLTKKPAWINDLLPNSIAFNFPEDYINKMQTERKFTPEKPFTPLDDIEVSFKLKDPCRSVGLDDPWKVIMFSDTSDSSKHFSLAQTAVPKEGEPGTYVARFNYNDRLAFAFEQNNPLEKMIDSIQAGIPIKIKLRSEVSNSASDNYGIAMSNIARVYGTGKHRMVILRGISSTQDTDTKVSVAGLPALTLTLPAMTSMGFVFKAKDYFEYFNQTSPFKELNDNFSHFIDLNKHNDLLWQTEVTDQKGNRKFIKGYSDDIKSFPSCIDASVCTFINNVTERAYAHFEPALSFLHTSDNPKVYLHELGHAFGKLLDEYHKEDSLDARGYSDDSNYSYFSGKNCVVGNRFGLLKFDSKYIGCGYKELIMRGGRVPMYRSTDKSMMNNHYEMAPPKFNVVSCSFIRLATEGGHPVHYYNWCKGLSGIVSE
ncbi:MAG: hypothetical protein Q8Q03_00675 [bacterium]|nr:hypothetical protein [bacterium]